MCIGLEKIEEKLIQKTTTIDISNDTTAINLRSFQWHKFEIGVLIISTTCTYI